VFFLYCPAHYDPLIVNPETPSAKPPDCLACGACCHSFDVWLTPGDEDRFARSRTLRSLTVLNDGPPSLRWTFMRRDEQTGKCVALSGELRRCACTIYEDRPALCREFEAGSADCLEVRRKFGFEDTPVQADSTAS